MPRTNIRREDWNEVLGDLSLHYEGWVATIEVLDEDEDQSEAVFEGHDCTLDRITVEHDDEADVIFLEFTDEMPLRIDNPVRVTHEEEEEQEGSILEFETQDSTLRVWLRVPIRPEDTEAM